MKKYWLLIIGIVMGVLMGIFYCWYIGLFIIAMSVILTLMVLTLAILKEEGVFYKERHEYDKRLEDKN